LPFSSTKPRVALAGLQRRDLRRGFVCIEYARRPKRKFWKAVLVLCAYFLLQLTSAAQGREVRRVFLLYSLSPASPSVAIVDQQIRSFLGQSPYQIEFYTDYTDTNLLSDPSSQETFRKWYTQKYQNVKPDVIIALASVPIRFLANSHQKFFPNVPIVFCCAGESQIGGRGIDSDFTGVWTTLEPVKTLEAALQLQPGTEHVAIVSGSAASDKYLETLVRKSIHGYEGKLDLIYLNDLEMPLLLERVKHLPPHTIVLYVNVQQDAAGKSFQSATQALPMITQAANVPVFVMADTLIGQGAAGGYVTSFAYQGQVVAEMAARVLAGERPKDISVVRGANVYMFDWRALQRWKLNENALPFGSIVMNRRLTIWDSYKQYLIGAVLLVFAEAFLIAGLMWQRARRKKVEASLRERLTFESLLSDLSTTFINLSDERSESNMEEGLARIADFLGMDRITIHEWSRDQTELVVTSSWRGEGVKPPPAVVKASQLPWWMPRLLRGEVLAISDSNSLPDEASSEREYLRQAGAISIATLPLNAGGEIFGSMSFTTTRRRVLWTEDLLKQLNISAEIFSNAVKRKHTEAVLRESEERFRLVANTAPVLIWMSGTDKLCTYFNKPWLDFTGRSLEAELGNGWADGVHPKDLGGCLQAYNRGFDRRQEFRIEYRLRRYDGEYRWMEDVGVPRFNADRSFAGYIGSCVDVTNRRRAEEAIAGVSRRLIEAQEQERTRIARELHDDINQGIAMLAIELEQLKQDQPGIGAEVRSRIDALGHRVVEIGKDVQGISHRLHSSKLEYIGLVAACKGFCKEFREQQKVEIDFACDEISRSLPKEVSLCLFRVLQEALQNAVKHSGVRRFEAELRETSAELFLRVTDRGAGFDPEAAMNGRGLGLISMRERANLVRGTISITSRPMGGTEISVRVPLATDTKENQMNLSLGRDENGTYADLAG
jgi:PAS domain S-box-containing protein